MAQQASKDRDDKLSKSLTYLCRHGAEKARLQVHKGGYITVAQILRLHQYRQYTEEDVKRVVKTCPLQRYSLKTEPQSEQLQIRANFGHSMKVDLDLPPVLSTEEIPTVVWSTSFNAWEQIKVEGLKREKKEGKSETIHIILPTTEPHVDKDPKWEVAIYVNVQKALEDGIKFYHSNDFVIVSPGDENGRLLPKYFSKAVDLKSGKELRIQ